MASREKRPLAPSKSKQKASESSISSPDNKAKKGKSLQNLKQQIAQNILDAVATGSQLPPKLEASLPRKKALEKLKRNQKLRSKVSLIKAKQKIPIKTARRINTDVKKTLKPRKRKQDAKVVDTAVKAVGNSTETTDNEGKGTDSGVKGAKIIVKTVKKTKTTAKNTEDGETGEDKGKELTSASVNKVSPKLGKKQSDSFKTGKAVKSVLQKKAISKDENKSSPTGVFVLWDTKNAKTKKNPKESADNLLKSVAGADSKAAKPFSDEKNSVDVTIDEVIASCLISDSESEETEDKTEVKGTRKKKMIVGDRSFCDIEIKKEIEVDGETEIKEHSPGIEQITQLQNAIQVRRSNVPRQRALRNGKLRQLSDSGISMDLDVRKRGRLNSDEPASLEQFSETISDGNPDTESSFSESSVNDSRTIISSKDVDEEKKSLLKDESLNHIDEVIQLVSGIENNNNGEQLDNIEAGPTLRSKAKSRTSDETKIEEVKVEDSKTTTKVETPEESKKTVNIDIPKKDRILAKISEKPKSRRNSLNIDVKKVNPFAFSTDKSDGSSKSQIDQMIENIKLTIAKSIESKIYSQEKVRSLEALSKSFEVPKIEEIVAPLSTESQKVGLEERTEEEKPNISKNEVKSDSSENSIPKVADTAKEIEKLVMGDKELVDTQSQNKEEEVESSEPKISVNDDQKGDKDEVEIQVEVQEDVDQRTKKEAENTVKIDEEVDEARAVTKICLGESKVEGIPDPENSKKPGKSKTVQEISEDKTDCLDTEITKCDSADQGERVPSPIEIATPEILKPQEVSEKCIEESMDVSNKTVDSDNDFTLNISMTDEVETLESISRDVEALVADEISEKKEETDKEAPSMKMEVDNQDDVISTVEPSLPCSEKTTDESVSVEMEIETVHTNNHLSTEGCDNVSETSLQKLTQSASEETETKSDKSNEQAESSDSLSLVLSISESSQNSPKSDKTEDEDSLKDEEQKKRVLRVREKQKKADAMEVEVNENSEEKLEVEEEPAANTETHSIESALSEEKVETLQVETLEVETLQVETLQVETLQVETLQVESQALNNAQSIEKVEEEAPVRTRRVREGKKSVQNSNLKTKRSRKDGKKSDQQNKEETLLDNEVAKINENKLANKYSKSAEGAETLRGCSVPSTNETKNETNTNQNNASSNRSKSENDLENMQESERNDSHAGSFIPKESKNESLVLDEEKATKTPDTLQKDSDEASTSSDSSSSIIQETPEEKAKKEAILRLLGLESWEKAAERLNHQKARRELSSGTLKMRFQKGREKDKMRSRSPLKMVLKQGRVDGEGESLEFYTIQKEFGPSGVGESSSGANRKLTTNHRHSCDEDNEETPSKDRQSLVIPEKSSSFSIHPGRCCGDVCCYCFGKFGSLDTPMHLAQMKSDARRQKILNLERHLTKDSCLCDACYRHIDRKANQSPTNIQTRPQRPHRQFLVPKCCALDCGEPARHHVRRRWLQKVKVGLKNEVKINWESNQLTSMSFCVPHYSKVVKFLTCALCKRRLQKNQSFSLSFNETNELNQNFKPQGMEIPTIAGTFICKLCRCFTSLQIKYKTVENMHKTNKEFYKKYRAKILSCRNSGGMGNESDEMPSQGSKDKDREKRKKSKCPSQTKNGRSSSKSPEAINPASSASSSEKSTPQPSKEDESNPVKENERTDEPVKTAESATPGDLNTANDGTVRTDVQFLVIEKTIEKLKKRKALEALSYSNLSANTSESSEGANVVEILAMDKEVTLTRLPKRAKTSNDIAPAVQRLGANPSISVRTLFPGEEEMNLHANVEFGNIREVTPQGWEKCATMIQYDRDTKLLWQELQRPYGNQSSFLRHLILLEKYYRSGDLVLAPNASRNAINYSTSVHNRLISYEGPEKMDEPIMEPMSVEYTNTRRLSGGFVTERDRVPPTNTSISSYLTSTPNFPSTSQASKASPGRAVKLNPGVSIMKKPPPILQRLSFPSTSGSSALTPKPKNPQKAPMPSGGKVFQMSEPEYKRLQNLKRQKQLIGEKNSTSFNNGPAASTPPGLKSVTQFQKAQFAAQTQFQKHLRMQQEMLNRQSRSDFEPLVCDMRSLSNENTPSQNFLGNLNLPKSIQVTTKPPNPNPIPILPKIPKSLTVIPQTVSRPAEK
ncbi:uncharacterized protein LOC117167064 [Belonocnema kinseyi]|uniref:uncharacterized protein LOC117167064 n=1 Tax=Belonocnema kinseyi TaxID=2817044 RepID=UPI00143CD454|nr:uncharacterized protein LOC117167064 [Belonocnema kinseyi]XP_033207552.1 uncharacterized protein LOC117167064 [Belonocnema kinseyi]